MRKRLIISIATAAALTLLIVLSLSAHYPADGVYKTVESEWFTNIPFGNQLVFYEDGTYDSSAFGAAHGTWSGDKNRRHLDDGAGMAIEAILSDSSMSFSWNGTEYVYYSDKAMAPAADQNTEDYALDNLRQQAVYAMLEQGNWENTEGHSLSVQARKMKLDEETGMFSITQLSAEDDESYVGTLNFNQKEYPFIVTADMETMRYTVELSGIIFEADGSNFRLDS